jgi:hypothetical protein
MPKISDIQTRIYRDSELLENRSNKDKIDHVVRRLSPLVALLLQINTLVTPHNLMLTRLNFVTMDGVFDRVSPNDFLTYLSVLIQAINKKRRISQSHHIFNQLASDDVWVPFGENTDGNENLRFDPVKFATAVGEAMSAAHQILTALASAPAASAPAASAPAASAPVSAPVSAVSCNGHPFSVDAASAQCMVIQTGPNAYAQLDPRMLYQQPVSAQMMVVSCNGLIRVSNLTINHDYILTKPGQVCVFSLNPAGIIQLECRLNSATTDKDKKIELRFPQTPQTPEFHASVPVTYPEKSKLIHFYDPSVVRDPFGGFKGWNLVMTYQTDSLTAILTCGDNAKCIDAGERVYVVEVDVLKISMKFLKTMQNVRIHGNMKLPHCPLETVVAARFKTPEELSESVCIMLDKLGQDSTQPDLFRLPYLYTLDVANNTCVKRKINHARMNRLPNEVSLHYLDDANYARLITQDVEMMLMKNILFQMTFTYGKFGGEFRQCPEHSMVIDFYIRRPHGAVGFHYDLTANFQVSTLSLLYSMPRDMVRPGPMVAPLHLGAAVSPSTAVTTFNVARNVCVVVNNVAATHSTPHMATLTERGPTKILFTREDNTTTTREVFDFPQMWVPEEFSKTIETTIKVPRSFLRLWHVVYLGDAARYFLSGPVSMFGNFKSIVDDVIRIQNGWFAANPCTCIYVGSNDDIGPTTLSDALKAHKVQGKMGGRQSRGPSHAPLREPSRAPSGLFQKLTQTNKSKTYSVLRATQIPKVSPTRASTMSSIKEKIRAKLDHYKSIFSNPDKNVVIYLHKNSVRNSATRRRAASMGQLSARQPSSTRRRKTRSAV